jgi:hypothetical protein
MSSDLSLIDKGRSLEQFDPERHRFKIAAIEYGIKEAKRIKDWPMLEKAVDAKIEEQHKFVAWRESVIRGVGHPPKNGDRSVTKLSDREVSDLSGITKKQAGRMAAKLADPELGCLCWVRSFVPPFLPPLKVCAAQTGPENSNDTPRRPPSKPPGRCSA